MNSRIPKVFPEALAGFSGCSHYFRHFLFVPTLDIDEDQIRFDKQFMQKTTKFQKFTDLFLATVK